MLNINKFDVYGVCEMYDEYENFINHEKNDGISYQNNGFYENINNNDVPDVPDTRRFNFNVSNVNYKRLLILSKMDNKNMTQYLNDLIQKETVARWEDFKIMRDILGDKI